MLPTGGFDGPVYTLEEDDEHAHVECASFAELLERELRVMESNHRSLKESGGYFVEVLGGGAYRQIFPARASGERALDRPDRFSDTSWLQRWIRRG